MHHHAKTQEILSKMHPVTHKDRPLFDTYFSQYRQEVCECTFSDIFVRAELRHFLWCEYDGHLIVAFRSGDCCLQVLPPAGPHPEKILTQKFEGICDYHWVRVPESLMQKVPDGPWEFDRNNSDYLYLLSDLRSLAGKKYDGKRNFVKRMQAQNPVVKPLDVSMAEDCIRIQELWLETLQGNPTAKDESTSLTKAMQYFDVLPLQGIGVFIEDKMVGFAIGEPLNDDTFIEHFEKALPGYTGLYPFLTNEFAKTVPEKYIYLNREQDLGLEGLRKAKESWNPVGLQKKYTWKVHCEGVVKEPGEMTV